VWRAELNIIASLKNHVPKPRNWWKMGNIQSNKAERPDFGSRSANNKVTEEAVDEEQPQLTETIDEVGSKTHKVNPKLIRASILSYLAKYGEKSSQNSLMATLSKLQIKWNFSQLLLPERPGTLDASWKVVSLASKVKSQARVGGKLRLV